VPQATTIGVLLNPARPGSASQLSDVQEAVRPLNLQVQILRASTDREIESAFEGVAAQGIQALAVAGDPFFDTRREKLVATKSTTLARLMRTATGSFSRSTCMRSQMSRTQMENPPSRAC
jgi:ABC-type uncharacterized transport system substrate-binding protein